MAMNMNKKQHNEFKNNNLEKQQSLLKQELDVNLQQQVIVNQRINLIKETFKQIPSSDPEYAILLAQMEMDQVELDELINKQEELESAISSL